MAPQLCAYHSRSRQAEATHKGQYDYSRVRYTGANQKVKIVCPFYAEVKEDK